jgi:hypothetical protein
MAQRPVFRPRRDALGVSELPVDFRWHAGLSASQKRKSVQSLHAAARDSHDVKVLEVSSKSTEEVGTVFSAFRLQFPRTSDGRWVTVESAYQAAKVFEGYGPFPEAESMEPREARRFVGRHRERPLWGFEFEGRHYPLTEGLGFYHLLYRRAILRGRPSAQERFTEIVETYDAFTDIEFNPKTAVNCQARCLALLVSARFRGEESEQAEMAWLDANIERPPSPGLESQGRLFGR